MALAAFDIGVGKTHAPLQRHEPQDHFAFNASDIIGANLALIYHLYLVIMQGLPPSVCIMKHISYDHWCYVPVGLLRLGGISV